MMRESVQSWSQDPWPLLDTSLDNTAFDSNTFLNAEHVLQLQDLFGQDQLDFDRDTSLLYDEFTFVPETNLNMTDTIEPSDLTNDENNYMDNIVTESTIKRRRDSSSSSSSCSSSSSEEEDFSSITNQNVSDSSSDSEAELEVKSTYLHRRQMEELILDKITNHLDAEKLPGILTIISKAHEEEVEEVEIDLAKLDRDQLDRILSYVNACLLEKEGGNKVRLSDYIIQQKPIIKQQKEKENVEPIKQPNRRRRNRRKSIVNEGHIVNGSLPSKLSCGHGPISMSALTDFESVPKKTQRKKRVKKIKDEDVSVHMSSTDLNIFKDSIASTKPKRKSAIHKRRLLEEMLDPSNDESEEDNDDDEIIVFGDEQMDLAVTHNETIVHQESSIEPILNEKPVVIEENDEEDDELIDIMI